VLASQPDNGKAWVLLTETALQRGRTDAAIVCADRAVALAPNDPIAHILRAKCLLLTGDAVQALEAAETASRISGDAPEALDALGAIFGLLGLHQQAADLFRGAVAARPHVPQYLFNLAATERMTGLLQDAEAHCDAAIAQDRCYARAYYLRADLRTQTPERNHIEEMEGLIHGDNLPSPDEVMLRFALAKEYEDLDLKVRAFDHVEAACNLYRRSIIYDNAAEIAKVDSIIRTQPRAGLASCNSGYADAAPVFVFGLPRTGTTLVERIIASHKAVTSAGETAAFAAAARRTPLAGSDSLDLKAIGKTYMEAITAFRVPADQHFVDKTLNNYLYCGLIHACLPQARLILVRRHPLDTCWAIYKAHFQGQFSFSYNQLELADYYLAFRRLAAHWKAALPPDVLLEVNYEDIVKDQAIESRRIIGFLGLPWDDEVLRFHESPAPSATASAVQVRRPVYPSSVGKWRHHAMRLAPLRARLATEIPEAELA
jgi:tetratricopeptide (TPR) repeat protein